MLNTFRKTLTIPLIFLIISCDSSDSDESGNIQDDGIINIAGTWLYTGVEETTGLQESRFWNIDSVLNLDVYALNQAADCYNFLELGLVPLGGDQYNLVDSNGESIFNVEGSDSETDRVRLSVVRSEDSIFVTTLALDDAAQRYLMSGVSIDDLTLC